MQNPKEKNSSQAPAPLPEGFKAGFVNLVGKPNMGKSTLLNALAGEKLAIVTPKAQTTRHRILGILNEPDFQMVLSDTPGILEKTHYKMHEAMMGFVREALEDADVLFYLADVYANATAEEHPLLEKLKTLPFPSYLVITKIDQLHLSKKTEEELRASWAKIWPVEQTKLISSITGQGVEELMEEALEHLPVHPPYYDQDSFTDRTERFLAAEVIREKIFLNYRQEVPYATEVVILSYKEEETIVNIESEIFVERDTQKGIIIGKGGEGLKRVGTEARLDLERTLGKKVMLRLHVKVRPDWRQNAQFLKNMGMGG